MVGQQLHVFDHLADARFREFRAARSRGGETKNQHKQRAGEKPRRPA
jgi:hypothetical protein